MKNVSGVAVVGAGASGMMAAITAARRGADVTLFEKNERVGKKILATGNGKCNLGNLDFSIDKYYCRDKEKLDKMFRVFPVQDSVTFFEGIGLMIKDKGGYLYPYSEQASAVLDVLRTELSRSRVKVATDVEIVKARHIDAQDLFQLEDPRGRIYDCRKVVIACGSPASLKKGQGLGGYKLARSFGHRIYEPMPGLAALKSDEAFIKSLAGVRCQAGIKLIVDGQEAASDMGELQFTDYGASGIPVFQISRVAAYALKKGKDVSLLVDFFPDQEEISFGYRCRQRYEAQADKLLEEYLTGTLNKKINMAMIKQAGLKPGMRAKDAGFKRIWHMMQACRAFPIHISGINPIENAQVCAGGVDLGQVSTELESKLVKGLYFAGEVLDVDGKCGGYNLQWAWTSGFIAGRDAAGSR